MTPAENATPVTQKTPNKDIPTGLSAPPRAQPVETSNAPGRRLTPEPDRRLGDMPLPTPPATDQDELAGMQDTPAPGFAARIMARKSADTIPDPVILTRTAEADMPGMDGLLARRAPDRSGPSLKTGLILTLILLLILALVAVWSALFLPDSTVARWLGREAPDVQVATPVPSAIVEAPATADRSEDLARLEQPETPVIAPVPLPPAPPPEAAAEPDLPDIDADLDLGPDPVDPETLLPSPEETEAAYATSGIWQRPPEQPVLPDPDAEDEIYMASIDPVVVTHDALALPGAELTPARLEHYASPPPFGTRFDLDANGLIRPTADGAFTPDGVQVFAGVPPVRPVPRTGGEVTETPETGDNAETEAVQTALLASFQPTPRPADLTERRERQLLGGFTVSELANRRPSPRPPSVQQLTLAAREAEAATTPSEQGTAGATFDADVLAGNAEPEVRVIQASALAVASSQTPRLRPGNFADTVARATQGRADQSGAATIQTASAPARVQPSIPSSATVSRAATNSNAINLRRVNLIGVSGTSSNRRALVRMPSGRFVRVTVGDRVDGGRVAAIGENTLQYVKNGRNITLEVPG
ncbi:hypothetical protein [Rhodophyticola sp. CCM32]|uniref:hypothetical protein n=1 Tax=Rhodophyticola sp. CCM32 TaxID=2916397 RepID=UPI001AEF5C8A|nr:hypothetical protein [Rhodophyticola sp. CCM32]